MGPSQDQLGHNVPHVLSPAAPAWEHVSTAQTAAPGKADHFPMVLMADKVPTD